METSIRIGIIGDYNPQSRPHVATGEAIAHAAAHLSARALWRANLAASQPIEGGG